MFRKLLYRYSASATLAQELFRSHFWRIRLRKERIVVGGLDERKLDSWHRKYFMLTALDEHPNIQVPMILHLLVCTKYPSQVIKYVS